MNIKIYSTTNLLIIFILLAIPFTYPLLTYPYDIYAHLIAIDEKYHQLANTTSIPENRLVWHTLWSNLFLFLHIDNDPFLRAKIIHIVQSYVALFSLFYFSQVVIRNLFKKAKSSDTTTLALWSTIIWFTIYATKVGYDHQIWNQFYSVNYQITLPLFWYITALTLVIFLEKTSHIKKFILFIQLIIIIPFIIQVHIMEFMYYLMYLSLLGLIYIDKIYLFFKKYYYYLIIFIVMLIYLIKTSNYESSRLFYYFTSETFPLLYHDIAIKGQYILNNFNRSHASINELIYLSCCSAFFFILLFFLNRYTHKVKINSRIFIFILLSSTFFIIPLYEFSAGLFGIITRPDVVHRIYYSSSIFILLPTFFYFVFKKFHLNIRYIHFTIFIFIILVFLFSKYTNTRSHNYYKNIISIYNSFYPKAVGFHLSEQQIANIGQLLNIYENKNVSHKNSYFYARTDIAFVIKYIYRRNVYWEGRRANPNYIKAFQEKKNNSYHNILFETPKSFPKYIPYW